MHMYICTCKAFFNDKVQDVYTYICMCIYIFLGEGANSALNSTYQKEDTSIEPKSTIQGS